MVGSVAYWTDGLCTRYVTELSVAGTNGSICWPRVVSSCEGGLRAQGAFGAAYLSALVSAPVPEPPPSAAGLMLPDDVPSENRRWFLPLASGVGVLRCS